MANNRRTRLSDDITPLDRDVNETENEKPSNVWNFGAAQKENRKEKQRNYCSSRGLRLSFHFRSSRESECCGPRGKTR